MEKRLLLASILVGLIVGYLWFAGKGPFSSGVDIAQQQINV
jgi:hypothetical protein